MKAISRTLLLTLLTVSITGFTALGFAEDENTGATQDQTAAPVAETTPAAEPATEATPAQATEATPTAQPAAEAKAQETTEPTEFQLVPDEGAGQEQAVAEKDKAPITGAFGITLGEKFEPYMVSKILSQSEKVYKDRGEEKSEHTGTQYQVEPNVPNAFFTEYTVLTNKDGIIYSVIGKQVHPKPVNTCEETKQIAIFLLDKYGKPKGRGILGEWFSFRDSDEGPYKGLRFYAQRCRNGRYSIVYSDDGAMMQAAPDSTDVMKGL